MSTPQVVQLLTPWRRYSNVTLAIPELSSPGVGIHGTPDSASIGYSVSHGCIRMRISDAEWLFNQVDIGTPVYIVA